MSPALRAACERALHVLAADGRVLRGGRALAFVLEQTGWGWFGRLLGAPPLVWAMEVADRVVAANRGRLTRWLRW